MRRKSNLEDLKNLKNTSIELLPESKNKTKVKMKLASKALNSNSNDKAVNKTSKPTMKAPLRKSVLKSNLFNERSNDSSQNSRGSKLRRMQTQGIWGGRFSRTLEERSSKMNSKLKKGDSNLSIIEQTSESKLSKMSKSHDRFKGDADHAIQSKLGKNHS